MSCRMLPALPRSTPFACLAGAVLLASCSDDMLRPESTPTAAPLLSVTAEATWVELEPLPGEDNARAVAVNSRAQAVGSSGDFAVLWEDGEPVALEMLEDQTLGRAVAINDAEQVAGHVNVDGGPPRAVIWEGGTITELGTLPGHDRALAAGISNEGHVVGTSTSGSSLEGAGFLWHSGQMTELPPLPDDSHSRAISVNASGTTVGVSRDASNDRTTYVMWTEGEASAIDRSLIHELYVLVGITDAGDVIFTNDGGEEILVWRDGDLTFIPNPDEDAAWYAARAKSPGGLILIVFPDAEYGILDGEDFFPFTPPFSSCGGVSDEGHVVCNAAREGRAVLGTVPLASSRDGIAGLLTFFDEAKVDGSLQGAGPGNSGAQRLDALRRMLEAAAVHLEEGRERAACEQLSQALQRTDGSPRPPDFAEGAAASVLSDHVRALMDELEC